ncbi:MAG: tetratricopeptide repeat protein [Desulfovibrionaceae bacterium]
MATPADKIRQVENIVVDFVTKESGYFLVAGNDSVFNSVLRGTMSKQLGINADCVSVVSDSTKIIKEINDISNRRKRLVVFLERQLDQGEASFLVRQLKNAFPDIKIIILTHEAERQQLVLLHEIGADSIITKPVSMNTLIEKIAFTVKPPGKLGQIIEAGKVLLTKGNYENALRLAKKVLELKPGSAAGLMMMGDAYKGLGKREKALDAYMQAQEGSNLYMEPLKKLAEFYQETGDMENYLDYLEKLDKLSPLNVDRKVDMGTVHVQMGNEEKADRFFEMAVREATRQAGAFIEEISTRIAHVYTASNPGKAEHYFRKALDAKGDSLDKTDIKTFNQLGISLRKQGKWREAVTVYSKALKIAPHDENLFYNMAMASAEGKDFTLALEYIEQALAINSDFHTLDPVVAYNIGLFYAKNGRKEKARFYLQAAADQDPAFENPRRVLAQLG